MHFLLVWWSFVWFYMWHTLLIHVVDHVLTHIYIYVYIYIYMYIFLYIYIYIYYNCGCNHCVYYTWICWFLGTPVPSIFFANSLISWGPRLRPAPSSPGLFQVKLQMSGYDFKLVTWWNNWISYDTIIGQWGINNNRFSQEQGMWDIMG